MIQGSGVMTVDRGILVRWTCDTAALGCESVDD